MKMETKEGFIRIETIRDANGAFCVEIQQKIGGTSTIFTCADSATVDIFIEEFQHAYRKLRSQETKRAEETKE